MTRIMHFTDARSGIPYHVRIVEQEDKYGLRFCVTHNESEPLVEFYDKRFAHTQYGQFVSRYYKSTLLERPEGGLDLCGHVADWKICAETMSEILEWI